MAGLIKFILIAGGAAFALMAYAYGSRVIYGYGQPDWSLAASVERTYTVTLPMSSLPHRQRMGTMC